MPQLRRPDYQPPQTLAGHIAPRGMREGGRHVTATSPPHNGEAGGAGAPLRAPSCRRRTVKGHCEKGLGPGRRDEMITDLLGNTEPSSLPVAKDAMLYLPVLELSLWNSSDEGKGQVWLAVMPQGLWGVNVGLFFSWVEWRGGDSMT